MLRGRSSRHRSVSSHAAPPARCAVALFDDQTLYIAAIGQMPAAMVPEMTDKLAFYVDTTGKEMNFARVQRPGR